jgi:hypothetical protein
MSHDDQQREPWVPPGHAERLVVGTRVRVRLSGECPGMSRWHGTQEDGVTGTVIATDTEGTAWRPPRGHGYIVYFDRPLRAKGRSGEYALAELVPLEP